MQDLVREKSPITSELRQVGRTDVAIGRISLGCSAIANMYVEVSESAAAELLFYAWGRGIRYFDTAPHYGRGRSEERVGKFLRGRARTDYQVSTKVGRLLSPGEPMAEADGFLNPLPNNVRYDYSGDGIEASLDGSCKRLGMDRVDVAYVHDIGEMVHGAANAEHMRDLMETGIPRLRELKAKGRIGAYGLGVNECDVCLDIMASQPIDVILLAGRWTLLDRSAEEALVPLCRKMGTSFVLGGIFNSGILATGPVDGAHYDYGPAPEEIVQKVVVLQEQAAAKGQSLAEAALRFCLEQPDAASVLIGTGKITSLARNLDAIEGESTNG